MRICPVCGHKDGEEWRPAAFHHHISYAYLDSLYYTEPELYQKIKTAPAEAIIYYHPFVYWKSPRSETVRRAWIEDFKLYGKTVPQERDKEKNRSINEVWTKGLSKSRDEIQVITDYVTLDMFTQKKQTKRIDHENKTT